MPSPGTESKVRDEVHSSGTVSKGSDEMPSSGTGGTVSGEVHYSGTISK